MTKRLTAEETRKRQPETSDDNQLEAIKERKAIPFDDTSRDPQTLVDQMALS